MDGLRDTTHRALVVLGALLLVLVLFPRTALAQPAGENPYGGTTTTVDGGAKATCQLATKSAAPGGTATVHVASVARGTHVQVRLDGGVVGEGDAAGSGSADTVDVDITFRVPAGTSPGEHLVTAVAPGFTASCRAADGAEFAVLGASLEGGGSGGSLPKTGVVIALLLVVAVALVLVGRAFLTAARYRAKAQRREQHGRHRLPSGR